MRKSLWHIDEQVTSTDLTVTADSALNNAHEAVATVLGATDGLIARGTVTANTPAGGITLASLDMLQSGKLIRVTSSQTIQIVGASGTWGTGQAADATNPRYDIVAIKYVSVPGTSLTRYFKDHSTLVVSSTSVNTTSDDSYLIEVVHGTAAASPTIPSPSSGYVKLLTIYVPATSTTVAAENIRYDIDSSLLAGASSIGTMRLSDFVSSPFIVTGLVAAKDLSAPKQLNVTAGSAIMQQASGYLVRDVAASRFVTALAGTTYYLDLTSAGAFSWGTSHSADPYRLTICTVTTDGGSEINVVTDTRVMADNTGDTVTTINADLLDGYHGSSYTKGVTNITVGASEPSTPVTNDLWIDTSA